MNMPKNLNVSEPQSSDLTVTDIIRLLGRDGEQEKRTRSTLSRYIDNPETRALLGASGPVRPTFPPGAVSLIQALLDAGERGDVTPKMANVWLAKHFPAEGNGAIHVVSEKREIESPRIEAAEEFMLAVRTLVERVPVRDDRLLTSAEAASLLACRPRAVSRYVSPIRRGVFRWSDVMKHIEGLRQRDRNVE